MAIEKVVILFYENHTLDNFASEVNGINGDLQLPLAPDVVDPDPNHDHSHWMNRKAAAPKGALRMRYGRAQLPNLYALMDQFTVCDNYFSDYAGESFPNHCFAIGADAEWAYANPSPLHPFTIEVPGVPARLVAAGKTWANYGEGFAFKHYAAPLMQENVKPYDQLLTDAKGGTLPNVSWVYAPSHHDFHPGPLPKVIGDRGDGSSMADSDSLLGAAVGALGESPDWSNLMIFITFDDWGGWTDHVDPPSIEVFPAGTRYAGDPYRYGSRVPCVVVGPYARARYPCHQLSSHTSLVAFIERLWGLPASPSVDAARRTAQDSALTGAWNEKQDPLPPPQLPKTTPVPAYKEMSKVSAQESQRS